MKYSRCRLEFVVVGQIPLASNPIIIPGKTLVGVSIPSTYVGEVEFEHWNLSRTQNAKQEGLS